MKSIGDAAQEIVDELMIEDDEGNIDFDDQLEKFAKLIIKEASSSKVKLGEKVKVFNAIQPYHAAREKFRGSKPQKANGTGTFGQFRTGMSEGAKQEQ